MFTISPEPIPEEQDVHADYDGYQRKYVEHNRSGASLAASKSVRAKASGHPLYCVGVRWKDRNQ